ncbi:MAG: histidinol-phosphate transaminase [Chloroflexales bacterium]|nr:histidinol-phosphate transaminase [Chloroflexales bacterium]
MPEITHLLRPDIAALEPYTPILPLDVLAAQLRIPVERLVKLDANENPYGPAPRALAALAELAQGRAAPISPLAVYPDPEQRALRHALSTYVGQPVDRIICGLGSDELIDLLMRLFLQPGDAVVDCPPTFGMYPFDAGIQAARVVNVPRDEHFALDLEGIAEAVESSGAKLLFVASPNNPSGNVAPPAAIERLLELPLLVVVDEAYAEFSGQSVSDLVGRRENLVVLRTFSKWAGLAGMRVGYALVPNAIAPHLWKIKQPYNVPVEGQAAALASLEDLAWLRGNVARILAERARLLAALHELPGIHPYPSDANFILCRLTNGDGRALKLALERQGILVRFYNKPGLRDCVRITVGTPHQNDALLAALREL